VNRTPRSRDRGWPGHGRWTGMVLPVAALALFVLCFLIGYGSVVQRRLEAGAEHDDSR